MRALLVAVVLAGCASGPVEPADACVSYVQAVEARDRERGTQTELGSFREGGACWDHQDNGAVCAASCAAGLEWLE